MTMIYESMKHGQGVKKACLQTHPHDATSSDRSSVRTSWEACVRNGGEEVEQGMSDNSRLNTLQQIGKGTSLGSARARFGRESTSRIRGFQNSWFTLQVIGASYRLCSVTERPQRAPVSTRPRLPRTNRQRPRKHR